MTRPDDDSIRTLLQLVGLTPVRDEGAILNSRDFTTVQLDEFAISLPQMQRIQECLGCSDLEALACQQGRGPVYIQLAIRW